jgi:hypothetical protein
VEQKKWVKEVLSIFAGIQGQCWPESDTLIEDG